MKADVFHIYFRIFELISGPVPSYARERELMEPMEPIANWTWNQLEIAAARTTHTSDA